MERFKENIRLRRLYLPIQERFNLTWIQEKDFFLLPFIDMDRGVYFFDSHYIVYIPTKRYIRNEMLKA